LRPRRDSAVFGAGTTTAGRACRWDEKAGLHARYLAVPISSTSSVRLKGGQP
jgi:hypothetical protein